jgi:voltage-gated potassium channel
VTLRRKLTISIISVFGVVSFGTIGYSIIEQWGLFDSLYMTVITLTTVGFEEVHSLSKTGKLFTIILILLGVGAFLYALSAATRMIIEGEIREIFGRRKLGKKIEELKNHYIICGYGRMGKIICKEMKENNAPFVVVENNPEVLVSIDKDILSLQGDSTQDNVLKEVGIEKALGLISVLSSDSDNLFVVLSARVLNPNLKIVARSSEEGAEKKLLRAGADRVISPYYIGGLRIAHTVLKPAVVDFIEFATRGGNLELQIEETDVKENSHFIDRSLDECGIRKDLGIIIVAIKRTSGEMEFNPTSASVIKRGDTLIAMGEKKNLREFTDLVGTE